MTTKDEFVSAHCVRYETVHSPIGGIYEKWYCRCGIFGVNRLHDDARNAFNVHLNDEYALVSDRDRD